jgi:hypothetical protein
MIWRSLYLDLRTGFLFRNSSPGIQRPASSRASRDRRGSRPGKRLRRRGASCERRQIGANRSRTEPHSDDVRSRGSLGFMWRYVGWWRLRSR